MSSDTKGKVLASEAGRAPDIKSERHGFSSGIKTGPATWLMAFLVAGALFIWWTVARADHEMRNSLVQQAQLVAQAVDFKHVQALTGTAADLSSPEYLRLKEQLVAIRSADPQCRFVYLMGRRADGTVFFFVDSEPAGSKDYSPPGQAYEEATANDRRIFDTGEVSVAGPDPDRWGTWVSALIPMTAPDNGAVVAVLGMDIDARAWKWDVAARAAPAAGLMLVLLISLAAVFAATRRVGASPRPVLRRLLPSLSAMVILLFVGAGLLLWRQYRQQMAGEITVDIAHVADKLHAVLEQQAADLAATLLPITADAAVRQSLREGASDRLLAAWRPVFDVLHRENQLTHFCFFDTNRVCLLRVENPENRGDRIDRFAAREAERTGRTASGINLGPMGTFTLRVVKPVLESGRLVGYVELGKEIEDVLRALKPRPGVQLAVVIRKDFLSRRSWEAGMRLLGREADWDRLPRSVMIYASQGRLPDAFAPWADQLAGAHVHGETDREIVSGGKVWRVAATPLPDVSGQEVGDLLILRDVSAEKAAFARLLVLCGAAGGVLLALLLGFIYVLLRRTDVRITAQQEALQTSEEKYRGLFEGSRDALMTLAPPSWRFTAGNPATVTMFGAKDEEEFIAHRPWELSPERQPDGRDSAEKAREMIATTLREGSHFFEWRHRRIGGGEFLATVLLSRMELSGQVSLHAAVRDITESKRTAEALRDSEALFSTTFHSSPIPGSITDLDSGEWVEVNEAFLGVTGYTRAEVIGHTFRELNLWTHPEDREKMKAMLDAQGCVRNFEVDINKKSGATGTMLISADKVDLVGKPYLMIMGVEITERKRAEVERERLATAVEQAAEAVMITDASATILYANPAFEKITGYTREEAAGQNPRILKSGQQDAEFYQRMWAVLSRGEVWNGRFTNKRKDGTLYEEEASISPMRDAAGKIVNYVAVKRDVTHEAQLENQLRQAHKMESVGRLAGGVAHDFNNMLGVIIGHTELALAQVDPARPLHDDLVEIRKAAERSADLTRQLLAFARKQAVVPKVLDLGETVSGLLNMLRRLIGENIQLNWQPGADLWPVKVDPSQIDQILTNLCVNARDAIAGVGKVFIETGNSPLDQDYCDAHAGAVPGDYVRLTVSDTGRGMDKETLLHLFEPFFTTKGIGQGTGLGLATVYGAVKQNNGFIYVYSEPGKGATFNIYLPRHAGEAAEMQQAVPAQPDESGHGTILLVEDEPAILRMATIILEKQGYTVLAASTPREAIRLAREHTGAIHLLMTDVIMPEMNGLDLAETLLALCPHIKRLFMSGYTADVIAHHGVMDEGVYFIQKPFSIKELTAKVREALAGK